MTLMRVLAHFMLLMTCAFAMIESVERESGIALLLSSIAYVLMLIVLHSELKPNQRIR